MAVGTAMLIGMAAASIGSQVAKSAMDARTAGKAAKTQGAATDKALAFNQNMWDEIRGMNAPYLQGGTNSMNMLSSLMQPSGAPGGYRPPNQMRPPAPPVTITPPQGVRRNPVVPSRMPPQGPVGGGGWDMARGI